MAVLRAQLPYTIIDVSLDRASLTTCPNNDIEIERRKAIADLLHDNSFRLTAPETAEGPYRLQIGLEDDRLVLQVSCTRTGHWEDIRLLLAPFKKHIQDYVILCDSFYKTAREGQIHRLEALDAGRRGIHDEAAGILAENLENRVILDKMTARRLFTLLYVLHMRKSSTI